MAEQNKLYNDDDRSLNVLFGLKLKQIRNEKRMSQEEFAWTIGVHRSNLGQI